jgi:hypothetical protein
VDKKGSKPKGQKCSELRSNGAGCQAWATRSSIAAGEPFCFSHDPAQVEKRSRARLKGGFRRRIKDLDWGNWLDFDLGTVDGIRQLLEHILGAAVLLDNTTQRMTGMTSLASTAIKLLEVTEQADQIADLERRLDEFTGQRFRRAA